MHSSSRHGLFLFCFLILPVLYFFSLPISTSDSMIWVASGQFTLKTGSLLRQDPFSVLPTREAPYPWGISIAYAILDRLGGPALVSGFHKLIALLFLWLTYRFSLRPLTSPQVDVWTPRNLALIGLSWFGSAILCIDRPAMIAVIPFILTFQILNAPENLSRRKALHLIGIELLWIPIHGSWILSPVMAAWRAVFRCLHEKKFLFWEWAAVIGLLVSTLLNPFGTRIWSYVFETSSISKARGLAEWLPTGLLEPRYFFPQGLLFYAVLFCTMIWAFFQVKRSKAPWLILSSPFFAVLALGPQSIRNTIWAFLSLLPFAASQKILSVKSVLPEAPSFRKKLLNLGTMGALAAFTLLLTPPLKPRISFLLPENKRDTYDWNSPFDLVQAIRSTGSDGPIFSACDYGILIATLPNRIFLDARNIIYPEESFAIYLSILHAEPGWEKTLDRYGTRFVLIHRRHQEKLARELSVSPNWKLLAENKDSLLFIRVDSDSARRPDQGVRTVLRVEGRPRKDSARPSGPRPCGQPHGCAKPPSW